MTRIITLFIALAIASGAAFWLIQDDRSDIPSNQLLLKDFTDLDKVTTIEIVNANGPLLVAEIIDGRWLATHKSPQLQFPIDHAALVAFIEGLRTAKQVEAKTKNPANFPRLGLLDVEQAESQARRVTLVAPEKSYSLLVGNTASNNFGSFVREPASNQTWQLDTVLKVPDSSISWLMNPVKLIDANDVFRVVKLGDDNWQIVRDEPRESDDSSRNGRSGPFVFVGMQADEQLVFPNILQNSITAMLSVRYEDIMPRAELLSIDAAGPAESINFETSQGPLTANLYQINDQRYVVYDSASQPWINQWAFAITEFNYNQFAKSRNDFVEPKLDVQQSSDASVQRPIDEGEAPGN